MQADEFEKKIQNKMEGFELVPDGDVWKQVSARIDEEKKKKRVLLFWIFTGLLLLSGASAYFFVNNENNKKTVLNEITDKAKRENYKIRQNPINPIRSLNKAPEMRVAKKPVYLKKADLKKVPASERKANDLSKTESLEVIDRKPALISDKAYGNSYKKEEKYVQLPLPPHKFYNSGAAKKIDAVQDSTSGNGNTDFKKDSLANTAAKKPIDKKTHKKWKTGFTVYCGISDNVSGLSSMDKIAQTNSLNASGGYTNIGNYNFNSAANNFTSAFSFGFGVFEEKQLTKRMGLSVGVDYHFYSAKFGVGSKVNQQRNFYDSILLQSASVNSYYTVGNSVKYSNQYQLIELPVKLEWQINKNYEKPLIVSTGISPGCLVSSNALYANPSANVYYADKRQSQRFQFSAQAGFSLPIMGSYKYYINAGPVVQYGFTNAAKASAGANQHLFFTGIKANIIFK